MSLGMIMCILSQCLSPLGLCEFNVGGGGGGEEGED